MKKRYLTIILLALCMLLLQFSAVVAAPPSSDSTGYLRVFLMNKSGGGSGTPINDYTVNVWRVANLSKAPSAKFTGVTTVTWSNINLTPTGTDNNPAIAQALYDYTLASPGVAADMSSSTGTSGMYVFSGLDDGIYLVAAVHSGSGTPSYVFKPFLIWMPYGGNYSVDASPKGGAPTGNLTIEKDFTLNGANNTSTSYNPLFTIVGQNTHHTASVYYRSFNDRANFRHTFSDLPEDIYTVTETNGNIDGFNWSFSVNFGGTALSSPANSASTSVIYNTTAILSLRNTYTPKTGNLVIQKTFNADRALLPPSYNPSFTVTGPAGPNSTTFPAVSYKNFNDLANDRHTFSNVQIGTYTVTESNGGIGGGVSWSFSVSGSGVVTEGGSTTLTVANVFDPPPVLPIDDETGELAIVKVFGINSPARPAGFNPTFTITGGPTGSPIEPITVSYQSFNDLANNRHVVDGLHPGTYFVAESGANISGYTVSVNVSGSGIVTAGHTATITVTNTYTPTYIPPGDPPPIITTESPSDSPSPTITSSEPPDESPDVTPDESPDVTTSYTPPPFNPPPTTRELADPPIPMGEGNTLVEDEFGWIEFDDDGVPLGRWEWDEDEEMWIFDPFPPLGEMPQTGVLRWPIPVLSGSGTFLIGFGCIINRRGRKRNAR